MPVAVEHLIGRVVVAQARVVVMRVHACVVETVRGVMMSDVLSVVFGERVVMKGVLWPVRTVMGLGKVVNGLLVLVGMIFEPEELVVWQARDVCDVTHGVIEVSHLRQMGRRGILGGDHEEIAAVPGFEELLHGIARQRLSGAPGSLT